MARSNGNEEALAAAFLTVVGAPPEHTNWIGKRFRVQIRQREIMWGMPSAVTVNESTARIAQLKDGKPSDCWFECTRSEWDKLEARAEKAR